MASATTHIILNGEFRPANAPSIMHNNRSFCYGDALFETIHAYQEKAHFFSDHYNRLTESMKILKMQVPYDFTESGLHHLIILLLKKNRLYQSARVRLTVFRNEGGYYSPDTNEVSCLIEASPLKSIQYGIQQKGLNLGLYNKILKPDNAFSSLKTANSLLYVMAGVFCKENHFDDSIILNERGQITETTRSNIFFVRGNSISTPPLADGCIKGIMRNKILSIARDMNFNVTDDVSISPGYISMADEIFLTNAITGVQWVLGLEKRRFFHDVSATLLMKLNETVFSSG